MLNALLEPFSLVNAATRPEVPKLKLPVVDPDTSVPRKLVLFFKKRKPGLITNSLFLYMPKPAGLTKTADISPPNEPIAPPMACWRAVPLGVFHDNRKASSGSWANEYWQINSSISPQRHIFLE